MEHQQVKKKENQKKKQEYVPDSRALFLKFDIKQWNALEKEISDYAMKVNKLLINMGSGNYDDIIMQKEQIEAQKCYQDQIVLGQNIYLEYIRPVLVKHQLVLKIKEQKKEKTKEIKKKKDQLMKIKIMKEMLIKELDQQLTTFSYDKLQYEFGLRQKKVELKLITFLYIAKFYSKNRDKKNFEIIDVFQLINIMIKIVRTLKGYEWNYVMNINEKMKISSTCIQDLRLCYQKFANAYNYTVQNILIAYPKLIYYTSFDSYFHTLDLKPYPTQNQIYKILKQKLRDKKPALIKYKAMIGAGKTSMAIALSRLIEMEQKKKNPKLKLLYCCLIDSIRHQVGKLAYNTYDRGENYDGIKFALGSMDILKPESMFKNKNQYIREYKQIWDEYLKNDKKNEEKQKKGKENMISDDLPLVFRCIKHYRLKNNENPSLVICDLFSACQMLRMQKEKENCILFIDEPNAFLEQKSQASIKLIQILKKYLPRISIFCSATLPQIDCIQKHFLQEYKDQLKDTPRQQSILNIVSSQFLVGCQFCSMRGDVLYPHSGAKSKKELIDIKNIIQNNPFLLRLYSGPSLYILLDKCDKEKIANLPSLQTLQINQKKILEFTFQVLEILCEQEDDVIERICKIDKQLMNINTIIKQKNKRKKEVFNQLYYQSQDQQEETKKEHDQGTMYVDYTKLCQEDSYKFTGGCLIAVKDVFQFTQKYFGKWPQQIQSLKKIFNRFEKEMIEYNQKLKRIQESDEFLGVKQKEKQKHKIESEQLTKIQFPNQKRINTVYHYKVYGKKKGIQIIKGQLINPIMIERIGEQLMDQEEEKIIKLLFCGIGLYSEKKNLNRGYLEKVIQLATMVIHFHQGKLAYLITDQSLCYGINFPISNIIITDQLANKLTMSEIFQLVGRAGRVGHSWTAKAFLQDKTIERLYRYIRDQYKQKSKQEIILQWLMSNGCETMFQEINQKILNKRKIFRYKNQQKNEN